MIRTAHYQRLGVYMSKERTVGTDTRPSRSTETQRIRVEQILIPKIFHFIPMDGAKPSHYRQNIKKWKMLHPGWRVRLWEPGTHGLQNYSTSLKSESATEESHIFRYKKLLDEGGVYLDFNFEPLRSIEPLLHGLSAFVAYESALWICDGVFGAVRGHPLLRQLVLGLPSSWGKYEGSTINQTTGSQYITNTVREMRLTMRDQFRSFSRHIFFACWVRDRQSYDHYAFAVHHASLRGCGDLRMA